MALIAALEFERDEWDNSTSSEIKVIDKFKYFTWQYYNLCVLDPSNGLQTINGHKVCTQYASYSNSKYSSYLKTYNANFNANGNWSISLYHFGASNLSVGPICGFKNDTTKNAIYLYRGGSGDIWFYLQYQRDGNFLYERTPVDYNFYNKDYKTYGFNYQKYMVSKNGNSITVIIQPVEVDGQTLSSDLKSVHTERTLDISRLLTDNPDLDFNNSDLYIGSMPMNTAFCAVRVWDTAELESTMDPDNYIASIPSQTTIANTLKVY